MIAASRLRRIGPVLLLAGLACPSATAIDIRTELNAPGAGAGDELGHAVAISGDTIVVGSPEGDNTNRGAAYVFERNAGGPDAWGQVATLTASDAADGDDFGLAVAISVDTIVVGAYGNDDSGSLTGSAYVFERNAGGSNHWGEVRKLLAPDPAAGDSFGWSVAISGEIVVVGAHRNDDAGTFSGSAYVFSRNAIPGGGADTWSYAARLTPGDGAPGDEFGWAVSVSGDTAVVGAHHDDDLGANSGSAYVFERNMGGADHWGQVAKLSASDASAGAELGASVSISVDTVLVGADGAGLGAAYVFERNTGGADQWDQVAKLTPPVTVGLFGHSVSLSGDKAVVAAAPNAQGDPDTAYVFERNMGGADAWDQAGALVVPHAGEHGAYAALSGDTAVLGIPFSDDGSTSGSAYVFTRTGCSWTELAKPTATDAQAGDRFGQAAAISGDTAVVGAYDEDPVGANSGSAYVFARNAGGAEEWNQVAKLVAAEASAGDNAGLAVAISGDTILVGSYHDDPQGAPDAGSAQLYQRNAGGADAWHQVTTLTAAPVDPLDYFGCSVALSGDTALVGSYGYSGVGGSSGAAYVFERNKGGANSWGRVAQLLASDQLTSDFFGFSVALSGDTAVVGAYGNDDAGADSGSAYVFGRNVGGADAWDERIKLTASDAAAGDHFGQAVAISGDTIVVAAPGDDDAGADSGSAYVFERNAGGADHWGQVRKLTATDAAAGDLFGSSVSISMDKVVVGAFRHAAGSSASGAAYVFERNEGGADHWGQQTELIARDAAADDNLGTAVSIDGDTIVVGASGDDDGGSLAGSAYVFLCLDPDGDSDGDQVLNGSDCSPLDGWVWRVPGEAWGLLLTHDDSSGTSSLSWQPPYDPGGGSVHYDAVRSSFASDFTTSWSCIASDSVATTAADSGAVPSGSIRFYLVRARNACGPGSAGRGSSGVERAVHVCP